MNIANILIFHGLSRPICGGQSRYRNLTDRLAARENKVFVIEPEGFNDKNDNESIEISTYKDLKLPRRTLSIFRDINPSFIASMARVLRKNDIDVIQISHPSGATVTKLLAMIQRKNIPIVYDAHNFETEFTKETFSNDFHYSRFERHIIPIYISALERFTTRCVFDYITSVSERDMDFFVHKLGVSERRTYLVPTGVRIPKLPDKRIKEESRERMGLDKEAIVIVFHGIYSHPANREAIDLITDYIAPAFEKKDKRILFLVGGTRVPKFQSGNVRSLGFIEDLYEFLSVADIAIIPLRHGAGVKVKFFDYLSMGLPTVSTRKGSEGIKVQDGKSAVIVDDVNHQFVEAIRWLADNPTLREEIGNNARRIAEEEYDWDKIGDRLDQLLASFTKEFRSTHRQLSIRK